MTYIALDTETQGLNPKAFIVGCLCNEKMEKEVYSSKEKLWGRLMELAEAHRRKRRTLLVYAHHMAYDWYAIVPERLPANCILYCHQPFIVDFRDENGRIYCKFLSTTSLWRGPLADVGKALGYPKLETPEWLKKDYHEPDFMELATATGYLERDTEIVMRYVLTLRDRLREKGIMPRWLLTSGQVAINHFRQRLAEQPNADAFLADHHHKTFYQTAYPEEIHEAVRGGRVECLGMGRYADCVLYDFRSHYPYHLRELRTPDLRTERYIEEPEMEVLQKIGVSRAIVRTKQRDYGVLPVRLSDTYTCYPNDGQLIEGAWTHQEISAAIERGYKVERLLWSVTYEETGNPFRDIVDGLWKARQQARDKIDTHLYKLLMNSAIGKFAQRREKREWHVGTAEEHHELLEEGWYPIDHIHDQRIYMRKTGWDLPPFYAPILNALVTADARLRLLEHMERLRPGELLYVDTDSLLFRNIGSNTTIFKKGFGLGELHQEAAGNVTLWAKKAYRIGDEIKLSGVGRAWVTPTAFEEGQISYKRMISATQASHPSLAGTFTTLTRDLRATHAAHAELMEEIATTEHLTDARSARRVWTGPKDFTRQPLL